MSVSLNLLALPEEIILIILEDADYRTILACKRVRSVHLLLYVLLNVRRARLDMQASVRYNIQIHQSTISTRACRQWDAAWLAFFPWKNAVLRNAHSTRSCLAYVIVDR